LVTVGNFCLYFSLVLESVVDCVNREVKHDVFGKRQTAKMKLLPSLFSCM